MIIIFLSLICSLINVKILVVKMKY
jgi:hypothetical protein